MSPGAFLVFIVTFHASLVSFAHEDQPPCSPIPCGILGDIRFPFTTQEHPQCGLLTVENCSSSEQLPFKTIQLGKDGPRFYISQILQDNEITLHDPQSYNKNDTCGSFKNLTLSTSPFYSFDIPPNTTIFNCFSIPNLQGILPLCYNSTPFIFYSSNNLTTPLANCSVIRPQFNRILDTVFLYNIPTKIFRLNVNVTEDCYHCYGRGGRCKANISNHFYCSKTGINITFLRF